MKRTASKQILNGLASLIFAASAVMALTGCLPSVTPVAQATPRILTVASTPALQPLNDLYHRCAEAQENTGLVILDTPAQAIDAAHTPLALRWGAPGSVDGFSAILGQEELALVVNPHNPLQQTSLETLKSIYTGSRRTWNELALPAEIHAWAYPAGEDIEDVFRETVLGAPVSQHITSTAPDPSAMREAIAADPAAIGFLPRRWLDSTVKELTIEGIDPSQLRRPILAQSRTEPVGLEKSWLLCVQSRLNGYN